MSDGVQIDGWLDRKATAKYTGMSEWWLEKHCHDLDLAPKYIRHGRKVWYRFDDLRAWKANEELQARLRETSGETLGALYQFGKRRPAEPPPPAKDLLERYNAEHGPADVVIPRGVWEALRATFTQGQRSLIKNKLAVAP